MKHLFYALLILPIISNCQNISVLVTDLEKDLPLPYANIYFKDAGQGASTNLEGLAFFRKGDLLETDSLVVSYIGYESQTIFYSKTTTSTPIKVKLRVSSKALNALVIKYEKPPKPEKIIKKAIRNTKENYSTEPVIYHSLYRETIEEDGKYIQLNEAVIKTHYSSYPQKKLDRTIWRDWYYDQSYAFELEGDRIFHPLLKDFNTKEDLQKVIASRRSKDWSAHDIETTLIGDPLLLFSYDKIKYQYDFFNPSLLSKYELKNEEDQIIDGDTCYVISFYPKEKERRFVIDQSRKNKAAIYIGRLFISQHSHALLRFQYRLAVERDFGFFEKRMPLDYQVEMNYEKRNGLYHIKNIHFEETKRVGRTDQGLAIIHKANRALYILNEETENVKQLHQDSLFLSTQYSSIKLYPKNYKPAYWNSLELDASLIPSGKLLSDLEIHEVLDSQFNSFIKPQRMELPEPQATKRFFEFNYHQSKITDSLHWMALPDYEDKLRRYLTEENRYAKNYLIEDRAYQKKLFDQLNNFYKRPSKQQQKAQVGSFFFHEDSLGNALFYYKTDSVNKKLVIDLSFLEQQTEEAYIKRLVPNSDKTKILVLTEKADVLGDIGYVLPFGVDSIIDSIPRIYTAEWYSDSLLLYTKTNSIGSARSLIFRNIQQKEDSTIYTEVDPQFDVEVREENEELFCTVQSKTENEIYWIERGKTYPRIKPIIYRVEGDYIEAKTSKGIVYLLINSEQRGSKVLSAPLKKPLKITSYEPPDKGDYFVDILSTSDHLVGLVFKNASPELMYLEEGSDKWETMDTGLGIGDYILLSEDSSTNSFSFSFSSPSHPYARYSYSFKTGKLQLLSNPPTIRPNYYQYTTTKRIWAKSHDGAKVPMTILRNHSSKTSNAGLILKAYGAYGANTTPGFDAQDAILLQQGYSIVYAHVRGESILGQNWYKSGRQQQKTNSILDYIACAEYLIKKGYCDEKELVGYGNSAGALVIAQAANLRPELFNTIILDHPYLDVINTMMNDTLPLTIDEYKEWGNPQQKEIYEYIASYSPYQNIQSQAYPNVLLLASYKDYQTPIWQVAKYTASLRKKNLSGNSILMLTDMTSGHIGNTTGLEWIKLFAETYSFIKLKTQQNDTDNPRK